MTFDKAIEFAKKIPSGERESWFAWQTGWEDWKAVLDVEQFKGHVRNVAKPPPLPPRRHQEPVVVPQAEAPALQKAQPVDSKLNQEVLDGLMPPPAPPAAAVTSATKSTAQTAPAPATTRQYAERRRHPRYQIRFRVIIRNELLTFRTFTKDVSLGGCSLENPIPEKLLESKCQIFIGDLESNENIRFHLQPTERRDRRYFSFSGVEESMSGKLSQWLNAHTAKASGKKAG